MLALLHHCNLLTVFLCSTCNRFWDIETGRCLYMSTLRHAIISISFHPSGDILAIASGTCVYTWDYQVRSLVPIVISRLVTYSSAYRIRHVTPYV